MHVTVRLFARLRELAGAAELQRDVPEGGTALDVWNGLSRDFPALADYTRAISVAVNEDYARLSASLRDGDEVAFLPPVSGGASEDRERATRAERAGEAARERACRGVRRGEAPR